MTAGGLGHLNEGSSNVITGGPELKRAIAKRGELGEAVGKIVDAIDELQPNAIKGIGR